VDTRARAVGTTLTLVAVTGTLVVVAAFASMLLRQRPAEAYYDLFLLHNGPSSVVLFWMGRLVLRHRPRNGAGRILLAIAVVGALHTAVATWADVRLVAAGWETMPSGADAVPADLPLDASVPLWVMGWLWVPAPVLAITMLPLVFPDGRLPGPRWRAVAALAAVGAALLVAALSVDAWPTATWAPEDAPAVVVIPLAVGGAAVLVAAVGGFLALALRWRAAGAGRRRQFQVVGVGMGGLAVVAIGAYPWQQWWAPAVLVAFNALLVAYALAVARYRLHDLEPVLGRAAVAALLSVLVAAVYLAVVVGVGGLVGRGAQGTLLPLVAVGVVALLVEPVRVRARRLVDRLLYRRHADRTEVLSRLAARASTSATASDVLGEVVQLLLRSTGAARAEAWRDVDGPAEGEHAPVLAAAGTSDESDPVLRATMAHGGERFGELRLYARATADLAPDARRLLDDVAHALGLVLRNDRLTARLRAQLDELRASRRRLVEAQDRARRGLERDIHDGAQARLVAVRLRVGALLARARVPDGVDAHRLTADLEALGLEVDSAIRSLRGLSRGLHPPVLDQAGLVEALRGFVRDLPVPVEVGGRGVARYPRAVEGAVYFCCLEAVQNAVRHGGAATVDVGLTAEDGELRFSVADDGTGFDPDAVSHGTGLTNIGDRVSALGGRMRVDSHPGGGTRVTGAVPAQPLTEDR
jgi:signal transduction histidine kinase